MNVFGFTNDVLLGGGGDGVKSSPHKSL